MSHVPLVRWYASLASYGVPQAAAPIAFALVALPLTGDANSGAAMVLGFTAAQLIGAVPLARLGRHFHAISYLKLLLLIRALALGAIAAFAAMGAPFVTLVIAAAVAGLVNGAAFGFLRAVLNHLVATGKLPRALGLAATVNEVIFVTSPLLASGLGAVSPVLAVAALTLIGAAPLLLLPTMPRPAPVGSATSAGRILSPTILLWLFAATALYAAVGAVEIAAVALAVNFGYTPELGFIFPVALCIAAVAGGVWVTTRNRRPSRHMVIVYLCLVTLGASLIAWNHSIAVTLPAAALVGFFLPLLSTYFQLVLDELAPPQRKAEVFALLRNATALGVITISLALTLCSLTTTLVIAAALVLTATLTVITAALRNSI
ncbi:MFS transporter [Nesterenkonia alba]|uniref:MFS transporter n=1 Tax=Nesterenkonia alba TaxID=515814 RepID=UPI0003B4D578|nr:MFS transporter [Nesterenkonia alba]